MGDEHQGDAASLRALREEIAATQGRRAAYVRQKMGFLIALLGVGGVATSGSVATPLLFLVPVVAFVFDLYILGEDFAVKRAGTFLRESPTVPNEERLWEQFCEKSRDPFSHLAHLLSSGVADLAAGILLWTREPGTAGAWLWLLCAVFLFSVSLGYRRKQDARGNTLMEKARRVRGHS
jgi:hypothetical protein